MSGKGRALRGPGWLEQARERRAAEPASTFKQSPPQLSRAMVACLLLPPAVLRQAATIVARGAS